MGRMLDNIVYLELKRRDYSMQVGEHDAMDIDFVASSITVGREHHRVCLSMNDPETEKRGLGSLRFVRGHHPKIALTLDSVIRYRTEDEIAVQSATDRLLGRG